VEYIFCILPFYRCLFDKMKWCAMGYWYAAKSLNVWNSFLAYLAHPNLLGTKSCCKSSTIKTIRLMPLLAFVRRLLIFFDLLASTIWHCAFRSVQILMWDRKGHNSLVRQRFLAWICQHNCCKFWLCRNSNQCHVVVLVS
jgi:hypothetical protein